MFENVKLLAHFTFFCRGDSVRDSLPLLCQCEKKVCFDNSLPVLLLGCYYFVFQTVGDWEKVFPFSTRISWHSAIFFPSYGKSHSREKIYMTTTCSYFGMTNTTMKQKKFPIKINHMSAFSSGSASSQLRKYALAVDHGVNTYLLYSKWPVEEQTEIWASADYENEQKSPPRAGHPMLSPMHP